MARMICYSDNAAADTAHLERRQRTGLAVFTGGNLTSGYGLETIRGVTARLLRR
jgi:hypothetical protein